VVTTNELVVNADFLFYLIVSQTNTTKFMTLKQKVQVVSFKPQGSIDLQGGMALSEQMATVTPQPHQLWVIDLAAVDFMDSSGLVSLVQGLKVARQSGCRLVLCNVKAPVRLILELTQLDSVFEMFGTYEEIPDVAQNSQDLVLAS
jgi:anti-sigma B factor antagonist